MIHRELDIKIDYEKLGVDNDGYQATMSLYLPVNSYEIDPNRRRPTVVICPGGAYWYTSDREAEPIALKFAAADFNAVVLRYSIENARFPAALLELSYAVSMLRENAEEWNVDTQKIVVLGFSAGGHLAANFGTLWNRDIVKKALGHKGDENKPNGMILCYPVINSGKYAHRDTFLNFLGEKANDKELLELVSPEKQVNEDTPPAFIWHTFEDNAVPVENSLLMAQALTEKKISTELHIFPKGRHGLSLANEAVYGNYTGEASECQVWADMAIRWIKNL